MEAEFGEELRGNPCRGVFGGFAQPGAGDLSLGLLLLFKLLKLLMLF